MFNKKSAPTILTNRLFIRVVDRADYKDYFRFCSKPNVCKYLTFNPYSNTLQAKRAIDNMIRAYIVGSDVNFSIILSEKKEVIGSISISFKRNNVGEIGYILDDFYWNNKIMDEALKGIIKICNEYYNLDCLVASYISENLASKKLLERNGFKLYETLPCGLIKNNIAYDLSKVILYLK